MHRPQLLAFFGTLVAVVALLVVSTPPRASFLRADVLAPGFADQVPDWALSSALEMQRRGIVRGYEDGRFGAADPVTRAQLVTVLVRAFLPAGKQPAAAPAFPDLVPSHFSFASVALAQEEGWLQGFAEELFHPDVPAARAEIAYLLARAMGLTVAASVPPDDVLFPDVTAQTPYATSILAVRDRGIMRGNPDGTYAPYSRVNRATLVTVLARALGGTSSSLSSTGSSVSSSSSSVCGPCTLPNAVSACTAGACAVQGCVAGWADVNTTAADGCEVSLLTSLQHCGAVTHACSFPHTGTVACVGGLCTLVSCESGWVDRNGLKDDGCELDVWTDPLNCGVAGRHCPLPPHATVATCTNGACSYTCVEGWADGNGAAADGCELDLMHDLENCGAAGTRCEVPAHAIQATCIGGACGFESCESGWADANGSAGDGCEIDILTNVDHCGGVGNKCATRNHATTTCIFGTCGYQCTSGYIDGDGEAYNGCETQL